MFLQALSCNNTTGKIPVWLMRQAGRYMASYRSLRAQYSFHDLCLTPELAARVTCLPIEAFDFDAAILFSDILLPLMALGVHTVFREQKGPQLISQGWATLRPPVDSTSALQETIPGVYRAASLLCHSLDRPLIGFSGAPWTLAAYLIEEEASVSWPKTLNAVLTNLQEVKTLILALEEMVVAHLTLQIQAGVSAIQIFDSHAAILPDDKVEELSIQPILRIIRRLPTCPIIVYKVTDRTAHFFTSGPAALSCDSSVDISSLRASIAPSIALQGNLDPQLLLGSKEILLQKVRHICSCMREDKGFIFNLSGGVPPQTDEETIRLLIATVREQRSV